MKNMTLDGLTHEYDKLIGVTLINIHTLSKEKMKICLLNFDKKNLEHLYLLRIALYARDVYGFPIEIDTSKWAVFCLNRKLRKNFSKVARARYLNKGINTTEILDFMRAAVAETLGANFSFGDIYKYYYEGSLN